MKKFYIVVWSLVLLSANSVRAIELEIKVSNIDVKRSGNIVVMIFGKEGFPMKHEMAFSIQTKYLLSETMRFNFETNMKELAVKVLHDENSDGKVTKNWMRLYPKEGLGFSNDQKIGLKGAPKYKNSKLLKTQFKDGINISITYP